MTTDSNRLAEIQERWQKDSVFDAYSLKEASKDISWMLEHNKTIQSERDAAFDQLGTCHKVLEKRDKQIAALVPAAKYGIKPIHPNLTEKEREAAKSALAELEGK